MENPSSAADQHIPSFFQNSCTGTGASKREENEDSSRNSSKNPMRPKVLGIEDETNLHETGTAEQVQTEKEGWTRSLILLPSFNAEKIYDRMIKNSITMPKKGAAPKAFRNKNKDTGCGRKATYEKIWLSPM